MTLPDPFEEARWTRQDALFLAFAAAWLIVLGIILPRDAYLYRADMLYFHAVEYAVRDAIAQGQPPLWNPYFAEPLLANPQSMALYPVHALLRFLPIPAVMTISLGFHLWLMVAALYWMLREWGLSRTASMGASLATGFSTLLVSRAVVGHVAQLPAYPWAILAAVFYRRLLHRFRLSDLLLCILSVVMIVLSGHTQQSMTALLIPACYLLYYALSRREARSILRAVGLSALIGLISGGLLAVQLLPTLEYFPQTIRVDGFSLPESSSYAPDLIRLLNLFTPFLPHDFLYAPPGFAEATVYTGLMTFGLVVAAWRFGPARYHGLVRYLVIVTALVVLVALGTNGPFWSLMFAVAPFLRAPGRFLQVWTFTGALLTAIGIEALLTREDRRKQIISLLWFGLLLAAEIAVLLFVLDEFIFTQEPIEGGAWIDFIVSMAIVAVWVAAMLLRRAKLSHPQWMARVFLGAIVLDATLAAVFTALWPTYRVTSISFVDDFLPGSPYACIAPKVDPRAVRIMTEEAPLGGVQTRIAASWGIPTLHLYSANLTYISDLMDLGLSGAHLLSGSYLLTDSPAPSPEWIERHSACGLSIWQHPDVLPRLYAVGEVELVPDTRQDSLAAVQAPGFDPRRSAVVSQPPSPPDLPALPSGPLDYDAQITRYSPNEIRASVEVSRSALVVLVEPYYPGWEASVDGASVPIWRVNHALRGVMVGAGQHEIAITYRPHSFETGLRISLATLALVVIGSVALAIRERRAAQGTPPPE